MAKMSENSRKVLETLKASYAEGKQWITADLAAAAGVTPSAVTGSVTGMCKKGYAVRIEGTIPSKAIKNGEEVEVEKPVKFIKLTEAGFNFDPDAVVEAE